MFSARRLDYYSRSWIMQEYEFLDGVGTMYGVFTSALLEDISAAVLCTPVTNARDRLRCSHIPATGAMAFYMSGTAQTFDRALRHAVSISTTRHRYLKEDAQLRVLKAYPCLAHHHSSAACTLQANAMGYLVTSIEANRGSAFSTSRVPLRERHPEAP
ncbi:hypothetical protein DFH29DRAFT_876410 [Suillus ampliporus]|nr:hypothetical protein DFH29DRAFT_876410 [Suillus ampliporus]